MPYRVELIVWVAKVALPAARSCDGQVAELAEVSGMTGSRVVGHQSAVKSPQIPPPLTGVMSFAFPTIVTLEEPARGALEGATMKFP
jgi:hypothetical protein